jgi:hypothetical protein
MVRPSSHLAMSPSTMLEVTVAVCRPILLKHAHEQQQQVRKIPLSVYLVNHGGRM